MEKDLVKLGKEMKLALDKLIQHKVKNPEVGLLVGGKFLYIVFFDCTI